ncbi:hypothetical protein L3Q65_00835 (plasmid) [Amycolatopsis sp. FU40]|uniref:hypothetical protein n=1 Tax=Amycolatopsis sp. FU40 TaxID=2914159 RepID=UPI001F463974|nr:hypothetical protein [Amycolatopsis sp. FU40]UKD50871.1 hypothetical protein L3Q65_00835 [Amycolatopsis sp. FU40]
MTMLITRPSDEHDAQDTPRLTPCHASTDTGQVPMLGETTGIAGLLLTPAVHHGAFTGGWSLTHQPSGKAVTPDLPFAYAREAALWLAGRDIDWSRPVEQLRNDPRARDAHLDLHGALMAAQGLHLSAPLFCARTSWLQAPPPWRIWHQGRPSKVEFATFEAAAAEADFGALAPEDLVVRRDDRSPGWTLRCAAPLCGPVPAQLTVDDDAPVHGTRDALIAEALVLDWARVDRQHWICPDCVHAHQR